MVVCSLHTRARCSKCKTIYERNGAVWNVAVPKDSCVSTEQILTERGKTHGKFSSNAKTIQTLKDVARNGDTVLEMNYVQREGLEMILHKIGRIVNGDHTEPDHWDDIAGYATLVSKELRKDSE